MFRPWCSLLFLPLFAPACAPPSVPPETPRTRHAVILTDTLRSSARVNDLKDSLAAAGDRVLISGYAGETAAELIARLPWLLQPGVDLFVYDDLLAGPAGQDSLTNYLKRTRHPAEVIFITD